MELETFGPDTQEVRIATTMTGGVSLAIWMGGVAREMNLLAQASNMRRYPERYQQKPEVDKPTRESDKARWLYAKLIEFLDVVVDIDVLSGTSAGGINAVLLANSRVLDNDLGGLRDLWLNIGALLSLLRDPKDANVPSLLQGDARMYAELSTQIAKLPLFRADKAPGAAVDPNPPPTTLFVTTTFLEGEVGRFTDSYGTVVQDTDFRGVFTFTDNQLVNANQLALAARSTASFPGAFEPSFVPFDNPTPRQGPIPIRPAMNDVSNMTRSHWASDGGVLNNEPIGLLLQTVFDQPADRLVRRVLLYVTPTTGPDIDPLKVVPGDDPKSPFGLVEGLMRDMKAIRNQSIAGDLAAIQQHNASVAARGDTRLQLTMMANRLPPDPKGAPARLLTPELFGDYVSREAQAITQPVVDALMRYVSTTVVPDAWRQSGKTDVQVADTCRRTVNDALADRWTGGLNGAIPTSVDQVAAMDLGAFEGAKSVALALVRLAYGLTSDKEQRKKLADLLGAVHGGVAPDRAGILDLIAHQASDPTGMSLGLPDVATKVATAYLDSLGLKSVEMSSPPSGAATPTVGARSGWTGAWRDLADSLKSTGTWLPHLMDQVTHELDAVGPAPLDPNSRLALRREQLLQLKIYSTYLRLSDSTDQVALRLFDLYATQRAMLPSGVSVDQKIDLIQVSADSRSSLDPRLDNAHNKLLGVQMDHFGAFFKQSWRANDWMWGRLDGAGWLVHILLDPKRLRQIADDKKLNAQQLFDKLSEIFETYQGKGSAARPISVRTLGAGDLASVDDKAVVAELEKIFDDTVAPPASLPSTATWLARAWQLSIAAEELPVLAGTVLAPQNDGPKSRPAREYISPEERTWASKVQTAAGTPVTDAPSTGGLAVATMVAMGKAIGGPLRSVAAMIPGIPSPSAQGPEPSPAGTLPYSQVESLLRENPVTAQTLDGKKGSPLMVRTLAKTAAVLTAAVGSVQQMPGVMKPITTWARATTLSGYRFTSIESRARYVIGLGFLLLVLGVAASIQHSTILGWGGLAAVSVGAYLVLFGAWQTSSKFLALVLSTAVVIGVYSLTTSVVREYLFGKGASDDGGVVGRHVYWLGTSATHPLIALGVLAALITILGYLPILIGRVLKRWRARRQRTPKRLTAKNTGGDGSTPEKGIGAIEG